MAFVASATLKVKAQLPYQDQSLSFHERAVDLVGRLTLSEKAQQMGNMVNTEVNRDGIKLPMYQYWNEALHGVARSGAATSFPESKGMSSTWDRQLIFDCATAISDEARVYNNLYNKGLNYWCPTINMARDPRWGRDEENYGEDPFLAGQLAVQFIKGMQGNDPKYLKTVACAKHFAANNYEQGRQGSTSYMTKHNLREYYLPAFEMSVKEGKVKSIMSSYNALSTDLNEKNAAGVKFGDAVAKGKAWGGKPNAMNDWLLNDILRHEWGFDGYVTSDCAGVSCIYRGVKHFYYGNIYGTYTDEAGEINDLYQAHATADAIKAGNDMNCEFKNKLSVFQTAVEAAISKGFMTEADLDRALVRVLETRFALGEFDDSTPWSSLGSETLESEANQALALKAAQESVVLLKNDGGLLPITTDKKVALIGPYANAIMLGDYSGTPTYTTTPYQAFAKKMNFQVAESLVANNLTAVPFSEAVVSKRGADSNDKGGGNLENTAPGDIFLYKDVYFGEMGCTLFEMSCGAKSNGVGTVSFILDNKDNDPFLTVSNKDTGNWTKWETVSAELDAAAQALLKGTHDLYVKFGGSNSYVGNYQYFHFSNPDETLLPATETQGPLYLLSTSAGVNDKATDDMIARAVAVAQKADVVVFCGGTNYEKLDNHETGTESHDRFVITLPGNQEDVLKAIYEVNKNVVLVLETNSSMDITWEKANLPAIVEAWYGGQAQGQAICDVLYGDVNPGGKLTSTWYNRLEELPSASDSQFGADGMLEYNIDDWGYTYMYYGKGTGANVARQAATPMYPFGYGLSYTTFEYSNASISSTEASCTITNTGSRKGAEVVQVYVSFPNSSVPHMQKLNRRLVGFERVELEPGASTTVTIPINKQQLAYWNDDTDELWVEGGQVNVYISASSADDRLTGSFTATAEKLAEAYKGGSEEPEPEEPVVQTESVDIKNNEGTREEGVWTNGIYTLTTTSLDGYNQYFKMNGSDYTISLPADVVVKQLVFKECSNNYAGNNAQLVSVSSEGATCTLPEDTHFYHESEGEKHDIVVTIENHSAGNDIHFNLPKKGQPMCWIQLVTVKENPGTAPQKTAEVVNVVNNHAVVTLTFDREIPNDVEATINNTTVAAEGGSAVLVFPVWGLEYNKEYTMTIAAGAVRDAYDNTNDADINIAVNTQAKPVVAKAAFDYVVSNAAELDAALAKLKESNKTADAQRKTVFLKNGTYSYGTLTGSYQHNVSLKIDNWNNIYNVSLIGESKDGVLIEGTTDGITSSTLELGNGTGIYLQDMTIRNNYDYPYANKGVSVAVTGGNKAVLKNVAMQACQDTYVTGKRTYLENCDIYGTVDFICGGGDIFFQQCDLILLYREDDKGREQGNVIVAPNTTADTKWGYVLQGCTVKANPGEKVCSDKSYGLGRPWQNEPRAYYLNTTMDVLPNDNGWNNMSNLPTHFYEYHSMDKQGNALDLSVRGNSPSSTNHYTPVLTDDEAARFTVENVLGGTDSWLPTEATAQTAAPVVTASQMQLSWEAVDDARCYVIFKNGEYLTNQTATTFTATEEGDYTVRAANLNGGMGLTSTAVKASTATGISTVNRGESMVNGYWLMVNGSERYNLQGQRVNASHKGLVIVNGRKVINK